MLFTRTEFLFFIIALLALLFIIRENRARKCILLAANFYFYMWWNWHFLALLLIPIISDYQIGKYLAETKLLRKRRLLLIASLIINLGILGVFKYYNFFVSSLQNLLSPLGLNLKTLSIILPLGISFYTFRTLSYTIDLYRKKIEPCKSLLDYAVFVSFFPTIIAGPIVRASELLPQLARPVFLGLNNVLSGSRSFVIGLFMKVFVADNIAPYTDYVFGNVNVFNSLTIWLAAFGYSMQLYCDFAGYSLMAIGTAKTIGYDLPDNFNFPYLSKNIADFWRRWHITLSNWIRDYLYIGLGGNRKGQIRTYFNLLTAMALCGLWHGAAWTFVIWGLFHGVALALHRLWGTTSIKSVISKNGNVDYAYKVLSFLATMLTVVTGWVIFRADSFSNALTFLDKMFYLCSGIAWYHPFVIFVLVFFIIIHFSEYYQWGKYLTLPLSAWYTPPVLFTMIWLCLIFYPKEFAPFIYALF
jgi:alginate O-acetyltransferase complex protein AlgI